MLEAVVDGRAEFTQWGPFEEIEICPWPGFEPDLNDPGYVAQLKARMADRLTYIQGLNIADGGFNALPTDAAQALAQVVAEANTL